MAGVSLSQMAKRLHRDASSLSRFERGLGTPRDLDAVLTAYGALPRPRATVAQRSREPVAVLAWLFARWIALAAAELILRGSDQVAADDAWRIFGMVTLFGLVVYAYWWYVQGPPSPARTFALLREVVLALLYVIWWAVRIGEDRPWDVLPAVAILLYAELGYWRYLFGRLRQIEGREE